MFLEQTFDHLGNDEAPVTKTLTSREKYNLMLPIMMNITILASCHGTAQFMEYLKSMKKVEEAVRAGTSILSETLYANSPLSFPQTASLSAEPDPVPSSSASNSSQPHKLDLKFRKKLKARGRPKRPVCKLCSFNKSAAERVQTRPVSSESASQIPQKKRRYNPCPVCGV